VATRRLDRKPAFSAVTVSMRRAISSPHGPCPSYFASSCRGPDRSRDGDLERASAVENLFIWNVLPALRGARRAPRLFGVVSLPMATALLAISTFIMSLAVPAGARGGSPLHHGFADESSRVVATADVIGKHAAVGPSAPSAGAKALSPHRGPRESSRRRSLQYLEGLRLLHRLFHRADRGGARWAIGFARGQVSAGDVCAGLNAGLHRSACHARLASGDLVDVTHNMPFWPKLSPPCYSA